MDAGFEWKTISAIGTAVIRPNPTVLHVIVPSVSTGTITLFDSATAAGTSTATQILSFTGGTAVQDCFPITLDIQCRRGLTYRALGTPIALLAVT
jgi:hypothetical protein